MPAPMPAVVVLVVCKAILGQPDENDKWTKRIPSVWDLTDGVMHCRALKEDLIDPDVDKGAAPQPFNPEACKFNAMRLGATWDAQHMDRPWRLFRVACPTPVIDTRTNEIIKWVIPDCGSHNGTVICETENEI